MYHEPNLKASNIGIIFINSILRILYFVDTINYYEKAFESIKFIFIFQDLRYYSKDISQY